MPRMALAVQYDGRAWCGWQSQPHARTIQDQLESALSQFADHPVRVHAAGRTDTGVHATAQIIHFDTGATRTTSGWIRGVNRYLPASIAVRWAQPVSDSFHARFSARARSYCYVLAQDANRLPLLAGRAGWEFRPLQLDAMRAAARALRGQHDFSAFRSSECQAASPVRTMTEVELTERGRLLVFRFTANAFLHHMVRNLVGSLIAIGRGQQPPDWIEELLRGRDRTLAAPTFMADGLYLTAVDYPVEFELPPQEGLEAVFPGLLER